MIDNAIIKIRISKYRHSMRARWRIRVTNFSTTFRDICVDIFLIIVIAIEETDKNGGKCGEGEGEGVIRYGENAGIWSIMVIDRGSGEPHALDHSLTHFQSAFSVIYYFMANRWVCTISHTVIERDRTFPQWTIKARPYPRLFVPSFVPKIPSKRALETSIETFSFSHSMLRIIPIPRFFENFDRK